MSLTCWSIIYTYIYFLGMGLKCFTLYAVPVKGALILPPCIWYMWFFLFIIFLLIYQLCSIIALHKAVIKQNRKNQEQREPSIKPLYCPRFAGFFRWGITCWVVVLNTGFLPWCYSEEMKIFIKNYSFPRVEIDPISVAL